MTELTSWHVDARRIGGAQHTHAVRIRMVELEFMDYGDDDYMDNQIEKRAIKSAERS